MKNYRPATGERLDERSDAPSSTVTTFADTARVPFVNDLLFSR